MSIAFRLARNKKKQLIVEFKSGKQKIFTDKTSFLLLLLKHAKKKPVVVTALKQRKIAIKRTDY